MFPKQIIKQSVDNILIYKAKEFYIPETGRTVKLKLSTKAIKTLDKVGLQSFLNKNNLKLSDIM